MTLILAALLLTSSPQVDQTKVDAAVRKGVAYLKTAKTPGFSFAKLDDSFEFVLLTFVHAGVPESDEKFQEYFKKMMAEPLEVTYSAVLRAMILEELDRVKYQPRIFQSAQFLVDNQCANGQWSYGEPTAAAREPAPIKDVASGGAKPRTGAREFGAAASGRKEKPVVRTRIPVKKTKDGPAKGDNSNSQYAALGLRACHDSGIVLPKEVVQLARKWWIESQHDSAGEKGVATGGDAAAPPRGWCYSRTDVCAKKHHPYLSMTAGAVGAMGIYDYILDIDRKRDLTLRSGLAWLNAHWSVTANEGPAEFSTSTAAEHYYYLYALERAGMLLDMPAIGKHDWYGEGANLLLDAQKPDGSWVAGGGRSGPTWDTCYAILFLKKATQRLDVASEDRKSSK